MAVQDEQVAPALFLWDCAPNILAVLLDFFVWERLYRLFYIVYGKKSFLSKELDTLRSYRVYISPTM